MSTPIFPQRLLSLQPFWGAWTLDAPIGEGSFGKVFRIRQEVLGKTYLAAIKWIELPQSQSEIPAFRAEGMSDAAIEDYYAALVRDLQNEISLMSEMRGNSHIVSFEDLQVVKRTDEIGWDVLIRMELLTPLTQKLQAGMTVGDVIKMGSDLCEALSLCASKQIIHRDIKPDNIFINDRGDYKLGDFGVARQLENAQTHLSRKGTSLYMSPEIYMSRSSGPLADQYSLGLVMHRLLNGQRIPFAPLTDSIPTHQEREIAFETRMRGVAIPPPMQGSEALKKAVCKACAYQPQRRFATPEQLRAALLACQNDREARDALRVGPIAHTPSGRSNLCPEDTSGSETVGIEDWEMQNMPVAETPQPSADAPKGPRKRLLVWLCAMAAVLALAGVVLLCLPGRNAAPVTAVATATPTAKPTATPTVKPTATPTAKPTATPTVKPTATPTVKPTATPTVKPTATPTAKPTAASSSLLGADDPLLFPNMDIMGQVKKALGLTDSTVITKGMVGKIQNFYITVSSGLDLSFLDYFTGLEGLRIYGKALNEPRPLAFLSRMPHLRSLQIFNYPISDLSPLAQLTELTELNLHCTQVQDISALSKLTQLSKLELSINRITDISPLVKMTELKMLSLTGNQIVDLSPLANLEKMTELNISANSITDLTPLENLCQLQYLYATNNKITDLTPLVKLTKLKALHLASNNITNLMPLAYMNDLKTLNLANNPVQDYSPVENLPNLRTMYRSEATPTIAPTPKPTATPTPKPTAKATATPTPEITAGYRDVAVGNGYFLVVDHDGTLYGKGYNGGGQLGIGTTHTDDQPHQIMADVKSVRISQGIWESQTSYAITNDNSLWAWGYNSTASATQLTPTKVMDHVKDVSDSLDTGETVVLTTDGKLLCMNGIFSSQHTTLLDDVNTIAARQIQRIAYNEQPPYSIYAVKNDNSLWACQEGTKTFEKLMDDVSSVAVGDTLVLILKTDHTVWAIGSNRHDEMGILSRAYQHVPVQIFSNAKEIATNVTVCGYTVILDQQDTLWIAGQGAPHSRGAFCGKHSTFQSIATDIRTFDVGLHSLVAMKNDGLLRGWGFYVKSMTPKSTWTSFGSTPFTLTD